MQDNTPPDKQSPLPAVGQIPGLKNCLTERNGFH
jgi:hypothetical protein